MRDLSDQVGDLMTLKSRWIDDMINVSDINQFLYCPRRLYYLQFYQTQGINEFLVDGRKNHSKHGRRGGYIFELYVHSDRFGLHGKIDLIDCSDGMKPVERKRGDRFFENDVIQLCAYGLLLEEYLEKPVGVGIIYLFGTNRRHEIPLSDSLKDKTIQIIEDIRSMKPEVIPGFANNPNKCTKCSVKLYCLPYESHILEGGENESG